MSVRPDPQYTQLLSIIGRNDTNICTTNLNISSKTVSPICKSNDNLIIGSLGLTCNSTTFVPGSETSSTYNSFCPPCTVFNGADCTVLANATRAELEQIEALYKYNIQVYNNNPGYHAVLPLPVEPSNTITAGTILNGTIFIN